MKRFALVSALMLLAHRAEAQSAPHALTAWRSLAASTRWPGPTSGQFIQRSLGITPPFANAQPVPGWSALARDDAGRWLAMPDNGFGTRANSADFVLGFYRLKALTREVRLERFTAFRDPRRILHNGRGIEQTLVADRTTYPSSELAVDPTITRGRLLTGADFDVESMARARDGTLWAGEEFGPFILHFAANGALLDEPIAHPVLRSPMHPDVLAGTAQATTGNSRGFEALAFDAQQRFLYAIAEAPPNVDSMRPVPGDERVVEVFELDPRKRAYTGRSFRYRKEGPAHDNTISLGDLTNVGGQTFVIIERDTAFGAKAALKHLYVFDLRVVGSDGVLAKRLLVDLLDIADPHDVGGSGTGKFAMPFDSIESVYAIDARTLAVAVDTNFPTQDARVPGTPDATEMIELRFAAPIRTAAP